MPVHYPDEDIVYNTREFSFRKNMPLSATIVIVGSPGSGKSNLTEYIVWIMRDKDPVA